MTRTNPIEPLKTDRSLVQHVVEQITAGVKKGLYAPGQRLVAADLADEFSVSRAPVREALHILAGEGVVDLVQNRGAMIRRVSSKQLVDLLEFTEGICLIGVRLATPKMGLPRNKLIMKTALSRIRNACKSKIPLTLITSLYDYHVDLNTISDNYYVDTFYRKVPFHFFNPLFAEKLPKTPRHWEKFLANYEQFDQILLTMDSHASTSFFIAHMRWLISIVLDDGPSTL